MPTKISPDKFSDTMKNVLKGYGDDVASITFQIVEDTAKDGAKTLRTGEWGFKRVSGEYQRSFRVELRKSRLHVNAVIYSAAPHYRLTHLLEHGHDVVRNGKIVGRTKAYPHWSVVEDMAIKELEERLTLGLADI